MLCNLFAWSRSCQPSLRQGNRGEVDWRKVERGVNKSQQFIFLTLFLLLSPRRSRSHFLLDASFIDPCIILLTPLLTPL
jgi:hypothetical protein